MALFGDSPRFHADRQHCHNANIFLKAQTPAHVGPGASFDMDAEDVRSGWKSGKSPKHQPMDSKSNRGEARGDTYMTATLTRDGHIVYKDPKKHSFPPTGQYDPVQIISPSKRGDQLRPPPPSPRSRPGEEKYMGTSSPRLMDCDMRHGVLVTRSPRDLRRQRGIGPGSYFVGEDGTGGGSLLLKKSHNKRVSGGNEKGYANHSAPTTPRSANRSKSTGHLRPSSAEGSYFKQYTTNNLKSLPSPILSTPPKRFGQHTYNYSDGKGYSSGDGTAYQNGGMLSNGHQDNDASPTTPYAVSPQRGIPIGRVYN